MSGAFPSEVAKCFFELKPPRWYKMVQILAQWGLVLEGIFRYCSNCKQIRNLKQAPGLKRRLQVE